MSDEDDGRYVGLPPAMTAVLRQPVDNYVGLTAGEAKALAEEQGRELQIGFSGRKKLVFRRVQVELGDDGRITTVKAG